MNKVKRVKVAKSRDENIVRGCNGGGKDVVRKVVMMVVRICVKVDC